MYTTKDRPKAVSFGGLFRYHLNWRSYLKTDGVDVDVER